MGSSASCTRANSAQAIAPRDPAATAPADQGATPPSAAPKKQPHAKRKKHQKRNPNWPERLLTTGVVRSKQPPRATAPQPAAVAAVPLEEATDSDDDYDSSPLSPDSRRNSAGSSVFSADEETAVAAGAPTALHGGKPRHTSKAGLKDSRVAHPADAGAADPARDGSEEVPVPAPTLDTSSSSSSSAAGSVSSGASSAPRSRSRLTMRRKTIVDAEVSRGISKLMDAARKAQAVSALGEGGRSSSSSSSRGGANGDGRPAAQAALTSDAFTHALLHA